MKLPWKSSSVALAGILAVGLLGSRYIPGFTVLAQSVSLSFTDLTASSGFNNSLTGSHGAMWADATGDGLPDLYLTYNDFYKGMRQNYFYRNLGGGRFSEEAAARGIELYSIGTHGATFGDLDNDGDYDLIAGMTYGSFDFPIPLPLANVMFRNDNRGQFVNVTPPDMAAYADYTRSTLTFDMDRDGDLDIYAVNGDRGDREVVPTRNEAYRNNGAMQFSAILSGPLVTKRAGQGATDTDYDGDGDVDIIAANITGRLTVLRNEGGGAFTVIEPDSIGIMHTAGTGITSADMDNDGDFDLMLVDVFWESPRLYERVVLLYRNVGGGRFVYHGRIHPFSGFTAGAADLDHDGDQDLVLPGFRSVLLNDGAFRFTEGPVFPGPGSDGERDPRAVAFADIEGDGDLDFTMTDKNGPAWLVRNNLNGGRWLKVRLIAPNGQAGAFGAKVAVRAVGGGPLIGLREAKSSSGYLAQDEPVLHFGLGNNAAVDVEVLFLNGTRVTQNGVSANQTITIIANTGSEAPAAPRNLVAAVSGSLVTLTWDAPTTGGAPTEYVLEAGSSPNSSNLAFLSTGSLTRSFGASAAPGTYYVRVKARNSAGTGASSNEVVVQIGGLLPPQAPVALTAFKSGFYVRLSWSPPPTGPAPTSYFIEVGSQPGATDRGTFETGLFTTADATAARGTYYVRVRARTAGGSSPPSTEIVVEVP